MYLPLLGLVALLVAAQALVLAKAVRAGYLSSRLATAMGSALGLALALALGWTTVVAQRGLPRRHLHLADGSRGTTRERTRPQ